MRFPYISKTTRAICGAAIRRSRRKTVYNMIKKHNNGIVPCYCCKKPVSKTEATLEHIKPISRGGTDDIDNLSISHAVCNMRRGNKV
jgi:5-methylcytosine-specific restriction endonuclease McrA